MSGAQRSRLKTLNGRRFVTGTAAPPALPIGPPGVGRVPVLLPSIDIVGDDADDGCIVPPLHKGRLIVNLKNCAYGLGKRNSIVAAISKVDIYKQPSAAILLTSK